MLVSVFGKQMINVVAQVSMPDLKHPSMFAAKVLHTHRSGCKRGGRREFIYAIAAFIHAGIGESLTP